MTIEQHVTSLELSKRLWGLGVRRESEYYWLMDTIRNKANLLLKNSPYHAVEEAVLYPAYLASELGEMLPDYVYLGITRLFDTAHYAMINPVHHGIPKALKEALPPPGNWLHYKDGVLANAAAQMLIYLIENGYVKAGDL